MFVGVDVIVSVGVVVGNIVGGVDIVRVGVDTVCVVVDIVSGVDIVSVIDSGADTVSDVFDTRQWRRC